MSKRRLGFCRMPQRSRPKCNRHCKRTAFSVLCACLMSVNRHHICGHGFAPPKNKESRSTAGRRGSCFGKARADTGHVAGDRETTAAAQHTRGGNRLLFPAFTRIGAREAARSRTSRAHCEAGRINRRTWGRTRPQCRRGYSAVSTPGASGYVYWRRINAAHSRGCVARARLEGLFG